MNGTIKMNKKLFLVGFILMGMVIVTYISKVDNVRDKKSTKVLQKIICTAIPTNSSSDNEKTRKNEQPKSKINAVKNKATMHPYTTCKSGYFKVNEMNECQEWLDCDELKQLYNFLQNQKNTEDYEIGRGRRKMVYVVPWVNHPSYSSIEFALLVTIKGSAGRSERAQRGGRNLKALQPSSSVIQMAGYCEIDNLTMILTENCRKYGSLDNFLKSEKFSTLSAKQRLRLATQFVEGLNYLHYGSGEPKVHCDMHNPIQSMKQFLVTDDMNVVLNDVDEIPVDDPKNNKTAKCDADNRCMMSVPDFLAPEQRYTQEDCLKFGRFKEANIKSDVWKIPDVSNMLMTFNLKKFSTLHNDVNSVMKLLKPIHEQCKIVNVHKRANSTWVLQEYKKVFKGIS